MKNWTYIEHLAFVLCADAVASELDASWEEVKDFYGDVPYAKARIAKLRSMAIRSQEDIIETIRETCENLGVTVATNCDSLSVIGILKDVRNGILKSVKKL